MCVCVCVRVKGNVNVLYFGMNPFTAVFMFGFV